MPATDTKSCVDVKFYLFVYDTSRIKYMEVYILDSVEGYI